MFLSEMGEGRIFFECTIFLNGYFEKDLTNFGSILLSDFEEIFCEAPWQFS